MREYYIDLGFKDVRTGLHDSFAFDADGIPRFRFRGETYYNITFICHFALYHHTLYLKYNRPHDIDTFMNVSDWIVRNGDETADGFLFPFQFAFEGMSPPWISALGQGRMLSVLARAYAFSKNERFLEVARKAMKPFDIPVTAGGIQSRFPDGGLGFEEYPHQKPNIVLNGLITAFVGLYDLGEVGVTHAADLFAESVRSLERNLYRYDLGYWSAYDLTGYVTNKNYHNYHIMQLWALYEMTGCDTFKSYSAKWQRYRKGLRFGVFRSLSLGRKLARRLKRS